MYLSQTFKLRYAEIPDLFVCNSFPNTGVRFLKERALYFLFLNGVVYGPYKTYYNSSVIVEAFDIYELIHENKVLVIEPRQVAQEVVREKLYLRKAVYDDMERNTVYYEYVNKQLFGPYTMQTDASANDTVLNRKLQQGIIYIINEKQKFER